MLFLFKYFIEYASEITGPRNFIFGRLLTTDSISLIFIGLSRLSVSF